ncbi:MAG: YraN family protein [Ruminococcus sp.]|jgi:putative endonuclease|nr:YraN family protein [Ruminococcus sp.]
MTSREIGNIGETCICKYLLKYGYEILKRNYVVRGGEIDIIASNENYIVFVEVKTRKENSLVSGFDAITKNKKRLIIGAAEKFIRTNKIKLQPRYDICTVTMRGVQPVRIDYIDNAFDIVD